LEKEGPVTKVFRPYEPEQIFLMPASIREWLPPDHLAYFISDVVDTLDLSAILSRYEGEVIPSLPSSDDGEGAALCLLYRGALLHR